MEEAKWHLISASISSILVSMNRLTEQTRAQVLHLLCEGTSIRAVTRITGVSKTTVTKLLVDAGQAAAWYQDRVSAEPAMQAAAA